MIPTRWLSRLAVLVAVCLVAVSTGCTHPKPAVEAPRPKPRNAALLAESIAGAKLSVMLYLHNVRGHPLAARIAALDDIKSIFEGTGIEPLRDLKQAVIASTGIHREDTALVVAQHSLEEAKLRAALDSMIARSDPPGAWLELGVPAAKITVRGHTRVVALVEPGFIAVAPESLAKELVRLKGTGGFPEYMGKKAVIATVKQPAATLRAPHAPQVPPTITSLRAELTLAADGGADITSEGQSTDDKQAAADADALTEEVERATSLKIAFVRVRLFKPVPFRAEGSVVKSDLHLTADEIEMILRLVPRTENR